MHVGDGDVERGYIILRLKIISSNTGLKGMEGRTFPGSTCGLCCEGAPK